MKKLMYIWVLFLFCVACERDLMSYKGEEAIYFAVQMVIRGVRKRIGLICLILWLNLEVF